MIETPGHTLGQVNYFFPADKLLFAGDTLFSIGCGRVIEGTPELMWQSLLKLRALPDDTAHLLRPRIHRRQHPLRADDRARQCRAAGARREAKRQIAAGTPTVPSRMGEEKRANVFLRADEPQVAAAVGLAGEPAARVFAEVRARKNKF